MNDTEMCSAKESDREPNAEAAEANGKSSFGMSVFNLSNTILGSGILALAFAMSNTGILLFIILITVMAILSAYSVHLMIKCADVAGIQVYGQLGSLAFGTPGKLAAISAVSLNNIGAMSTYLYIVKNQLPSVIDGLLNRNEYSEEWFLNGSYLIMIVSGSVILPLCMMRRLGYLGYSSGLSLLCMVFFLISVIYKKFVTLCASEGNNFTTITPAFNSSACKSISDAKLMTLTEEAAYTIPILAFAFVCHASILPIYKELKDANRRRMQNVTNMSILAMSIMYVLTAIFGYLTFYDNVTEDLLLSYQKSDTLMLFVRLAVLFAVVLTFPVVLFPVRRAVSQLLFQDKPFHWVRHSCITIFLIIICNILVIFVPNIREIFGVIGATTAPSLIFILPGLFYIKIIPSEEEPMKSGPKIIAAMFAALGIILMIMSINFIIINWV